MADDDKNIGPGGGSEDPWAGLDADPAASGGESFEFPEIESLLEDPVTTPDLPVATPDLPEAAADPVEQAASGSSDAGSFSSPTFDALSLGAQDGVFTDDAGWNTGEPFAGDDDASLDASEPPLAVFPPVDTFATAESGLVAEDHSLLTGDHGGVGGHDDADADALAHLEDAADAEADLGVVAFAQPQSDPSVDSNAFNANESLVVGDVGSGDAESLVGQSQVDGSAIQIGTGQSGIVPFDDWGDSADTTSTDASTAAPDAENPFGEQSFDAAGGMAVAAGGIASAVPARRVIKKRAGGGGVAAAVSVLLGGVLSIPIVIGLLFWVFKKDPFHIAPKVPSSLAFLLPAEFQVAGQGRRPLPGLAGQGDALVASRSLGDLVTDEASTEEPAPAPAPSGDVSLSQADDSPEEPAADEAGSATVKPADGLPASDLFESPKAAEPKRPPPLDTTALDDAVLAADEATSRLLDASQEDADYKRLLKDWYTTLSKVGEETVSLEQAAAASGAEFAAVSPAVRRTIGRILADDSSSVQFAKLSRMWLKSRGRTSDGVVLPAVLGSSRKVGAWWVSRVRVSDDPAVPEVAVLSRSQPEASEGDAIVVLGLVFEPGVVWAAACDRFEPVAAESGSPQEKPVSDESGPTVDEPAAPPPAPTRGDDLFPLE